MCSFLSAPATLLFQNGEWKHVAETVSFLLSVRANHVEVYFWGLDGLHAATLANAKGIFRVLSFWGCVLTKITCICCTGQGDDSAAPKRSQNRNWCGWFDCWRLANIGRRGKILDFFGEIQCFNSSINCRDVCWDVFFFYSSTTTSSFLNQLYGIQCKAGTMKQTQCKQRRLTEHAGNNSSNRNDYYERWHCLCVRCSEWWQSNHTTYSSSSFF